MSQRDEKKIQPASHSTHVTTPESSEDKYDAQKKLDEELKAQWKRCGANVSMTKLRVKAFR